MIRSTFPTDYVKKKYKLNVDFFAESMESCSAGFHNHVFETAILHGLRPYNYLAYVMEKISQTPQFGDSSYLDDLLPWSPTLPDNLKSNIVRQ